MRLLLCLLCTFFTLSIHFLSAQPASTLTRAIEAPSNCEQPSLITYGTDATDEVGNFILPLPSGHFLISAEQDGDILLAELDDELNLLWQRKLPVTVRADNTRHLALDSDNMLLGIGFSAIVSGVREAYAFKYDYQSGNLLWLKRLSGVPNQNRTHTFYTILEKEPGGNYLVTGQTQQNNAPGAGCDAVIVELDRNSGNDVWMQNYQLGSCETFQKTILHNNSIYSTGRYNFAGGGTSKMRTALSQMDMNGNEIWSKLYLVSVASNARLYSTDLLEDNGNLVVGAFGDKFGSSTTNLSLFFYQTDLSGNLNWAVEYNIPSGHTERCRRIWSTADGYLMMGSYRVGNTEKTFLLKTDKQGTLQWSNSFGGNGRAISWDMTLVDDNIYLLGGTDNYGNTGLDIFLARMTPDGQADGNACDFISPLVVEQATVNNPYEGSHPLTAYDPGFEMLNIKTSIQNTSLNQETQCARPCDDCEAQITYTPTNPDYCNPVEFSIESNCDFSTYYWTFCEPDVTSVPDIDASIDVGTLPSHCDFVDETDNGGGYHLFVTNYNTSSQRLRRLDFGNSLDNTPVTTIIDLPGIPNTTDLIKNEGIDIVQSNGQYYGFFTVWGDIYRIEFGADITNDNPAVTLVTGYESTGFAWAHSLDLHQIDGQWWGVLTARSGHMVILFWGDDVSGAVQNAWAYTGGNSGAQFTGAAYIEEEGNHYVLACDFRNGLIRFDFGDALSNTPTATNLGFFGSGNQWSVLAYRECADGYLGFLFKETGDDHKVIRFSPNITSPPVVVSTINGLNRISGVSSFHRVDDDLVFFLSRSYDGRVVRLYYEGCNGIDIPNSTAANPSVTFPEPGDYEIRVVLNEGLPDQQTICETVTVGTGCEEICDNGIDDDGNGLADCDDPALADSCCCLIPLLLDLGVDTSVCEGATVVLDAGAGFSAYLWQDNLTETQTFAVSSSGIYSVMVVDSCGNLQTDSVAVFFESGPPLDLGNDTTLCQGESITFSVPGYDTYQWSPADFLDCSDCPTVTATPLAPVIYTLEAATALGCTATDSIQIGVETPPPFDLGNDTTLCQGASITFSVPGYDTYQWSPADFLDCTDCPTVTTTPLATVAYTLEAATALGCTAVDSIQIGVETAPPFDLGNDTTLCQGESITFSVPGYDTYQWSPADFLDCTDCPTVTTSPLASVAYTLEAATALGCTATDSIQIGVETAPPFDLGNDTTLCQGESITFSVPGYDTYQWSPADFLDCTDCPTVTATPLAPVAYTLEAGNALGCTTEDTIQLELGACEALSVEVIADSPVCEGQPLMLWAGPVGGIAPYTISWAGPDNFSSNQQIVYIIRPTPAATGIYTVTVTDADGRTATASIMATVYGNITDPGTIEGDEYLCGPGQDASPITEASPSSSGQPLEYIWMKFTEGAGVWEAIPEATGPSYDPGPVYATTQYVRCVRRAGCTLVLETNIVTKTVGEEALADISGPADPCIGVSALYAVTPQPGASYSWGFGLDATPQFANTPEAMVTWNTAGPKTVLVTVATATCTAVNSYPVTVSYDANGCIDARTALFGTASENTEVAERNGINNAFNVQAKVERITSSEVTIYPNPFTHKLHIRMGEVQKERGHYQITNAQGKRVKEGWVPTGENEVAIGLSAVAAGLYFVVIDLGEQGIVYKRVVKQ